MLFAQYRQWDKVLRPFVFICVFVQCPSRTSAPCTLLSLDVAMVPISSLVM
uniref:Uncharacterized protein n=1 Tax=Anguilla anguilla TaxID=7936 RepID=A0A0E9XA47_ANGAN